MKTNFPTGPESRPEDMEKNGGVYGLGYVACRLEVGGGGFSIML